MSSTLGRCRDNSVYGPSVPVDANTGDRHALLRRYGRKAAMAVLGGHRGIGELGPKLLRWISDARNLRAAWDFLRLYGGTGPGPNDLMYNDLNNKEVWELCRVLGQAIQNDTYRPGPDRQVKIPKGSGRGYRTLRLQNIEDRVVARAVVQIIQPLLDPGFDRYSFGYRPHRDRRHALAAALHLAEADDRMVWVLEDVKDAFDQVPHARLLDILRKRLPTAEDLWRLSERILDNGTTRGLRQGSPLSPLLLNLYLDHFLDRDWRKESPDTPLLRSADDLLVPCRSQQEALIVRKSLRRLLSPSGIPLKETGNNEAIRNLHKGDKAEWLGYGISKGEHGMEVHLAEATWSALVEKLERVHEGPAAPLRAIQIVKGWFEQIGPSYPYEDKEQVVSRVTDVARQMAFDEMPDGEEVLERWRVAYSRWLRIQKTPPSVSSSMSLSTSTYPNGDSSAHRHVFFAVQHRSDGVPHGTPSLSFSLSETVKLYTDGSCDRLTRRGGWGVVFVAHSLPNQVDGSGSLGRTTNNRAELIAVIKGFERLAAPTRIRLFSDSEYVILGIRERLARWKAQDWRAGSGKQKRALKNVDLWRKLDALMVPHTVTCSWLRGHAGDPHNEQCDRLARAAASR